MKKLLIALMLVFSLTLVGCQEADPTTQTPVQLSENIKSFSNEEELNNYFKDMEERMSTYGLFSVTDNVMTASPEAAVDDSSDSDRNHSETNVQVEGVSEIDRIITDGTYIYIAKDNFLKIVEVESMTIIFENYLEGGYYAGLYLHNDKLVVLYNQYQQIARDSETSEDYYWLWWGQNNLVIDVYDLSDKTDITVERTLEFKNTSLNNSRMIDGQLYLIMYNYVYRMQDDMVVPQFEDSITNDGMVNIPYENIYYFIDNDVSNSYLLIGTFNVNDDEEIKIDAYLGYGFNIYMNQDNLYIASHQYIYDTETFKVDYKTNIMRFELVDKIPVFQASNLVDGWPLNQFSFDEYEGVLRVATTDYDYTENSTTITNQLYFLNATDTELTEISVLEGLGKPNERIYAVRMNANIGYVVTFVNTDPLYKIDLTDPENPVILGELYEEGVSDYLHPISDDLMIGVGRQAENINGFSRFTGVKIALYDISGDTPVTEETLLVEGEYSYSPVTYDHKLFVEYEWQNSLLFAIPVYGYFEDYSRYYQAIYVYQVDQTNGLQQKAILMDELIYENYYGYIEKVVFVGDSVYTISYGYVVEYDLSNDFEQVTSLELNNQN